MTPLQALGWSVVYLVVSFCLALLVGRIFRAAGSGEEDSQPISPIHFPRQLTDQPSDEHPEGLGAEQGGAIHFHDRSNAA